MKTTTLSAKLFSFAAAALVTTSILAGLDVLATSGQSSQALLAQQGPLSVVCADPARRT